MPKGFCLAHYPEKKKTECTIILAAMAMSCEGLAVMWEGTAGVRRRVLNGLLLEYPASQKWCQPTRENAKLNGEVLLPCLTILSEVPDFHLPHLPPLQAEIQTLYNALGKEVSSKTIYKNAVEIKKLLSFIKRRANHKEVTKDPIFQKKYVILLRVRKVYQQIPIGITLYNISYFKWVHCWIQFK